MVPKYINTNDLVVDGATNESLRFGRCSPLWIGNTPSASHIGETEGQRAEPSHVPELHLL